MMELSAPFLFLIFWSSGAIFVKLGLDYSSPWSFLFLRCLIAFLILALLIGVKNLKSELHKILDNGEIGLIILTAIFLQSSYQGFYFLSINNGISPGLLSIILASQPILSIFLYKEKNSIIGYSLLALSFFGVILSIYGAKGLGGITVAGLAFSFCSVFSSAYGSVLQKRVQSDIRAVALIQYFVSLSIFFLFVTVFGWKIQWTPIFISSLTWMSVVVSVISTLLYFRLLASDSIGRVNSLLYLVPVCTIVFDAIVFGQSVTPITIGGMLIVITSVWFYRRRQPNPH